MKKAILVLALSAFIIFTACGEAAAVQESTAAPQETQPDAVPETEAADAETEYRYYEHIAENDLGGREFRIISRITDTDHNAQEHTDYGNNEIDSDSLDGSQINDVVYNRNRELEQRYNFTFKSIQIDKDPFKTVKKSVLAASDDFDAVVDSIGPMADYSMFACLDGLPDLDLYADCWDQNVNTSLSIGKKHYIAVGDMLILDKKGTWCQLFNKKIAGNLGLENLYDLVRDGKWTIDKFDSLIRLGAMDLNGDGVMDETDAWGFLTEAYNINILMFGGGTRFSVKDENDYPVVSLFSDKTVSVFEKAYKIMADKTVSLSMSWSKNGAADCLKGFADDRGLFYMTGIGTAMEFRYMDSDFGIIPIAKYDEAQENYYTSFSVYNSAAAAIPKSCADAAGSAFLLQAICLASTNTLQTTFYDTVLNGITIRDEESREMLDILFSNRVFDLAFINGWGGISDIYTSLLSSKTPDLASKYGKMEKKVNSAIEKAIEQYMEME